jgi:hypothetical protein
LSTITNDSTICLCVSWEVAGCERQQRTLRRLEKRGQQRREKKKKTSFISFSRWIWSCGGGGGDGDGREADEGSMIYDCVYRGWQCFQVN